MAKNILTELDENARKELEQLSALKPYAEQALNALRELRSKTLATKEIEHILRQLWRAWNYLGRTVAYADRDTQRMDHVLEKVISLLERGSTKEKAETLRQQFLALERKIVHDFSRYFGTERDELKNIEKEEHLLAQMKKRKLATDAKQQELAGDIGSAELHFRKLEDMVAGSIRLLEEIERLASALAKGKAA